VAEIPAKLVRLRERLKNLDRSQRIQMLIDIGEQYREVPPAVAQRPFDESRRVPACESQAFVWAVDENDSVKYYFAVENPQGVSAKATAALIDRTCSGAPLEEIAAIPPDIVYELFGGELSVAKNMGLTNMLEMCRQEAKSRLTQRKTS
jgi:cysteine desulfuration protein SufE